MEKICHEKNNKTISFLRVATLIFYRGKYFSIFFKYIFRVKNYKIVIKIIKNVFLIENDQNKFMCFGVLHNLFGDELPLNPIKTI